MLGCGGHHVGLPLGVQPFLVVVAAAAAAVAVLASVVWVQRAAQSCWGIIIFMSHILVKSEADFCVNLCIKSLSQVKIVANCNV